MENENARELKSVTKFSRRDFLKGTLAVGAMASVGGVLGGCSPQQKGGSTEGSASVDNEKEANHRDAFAPNKTKDVDVVIVGAGVGGMAAALQAVELGMSAVLLEKQSVAGGTSTYAEGMFAINSHWQKECGAEYTTAGVLQDVMAYHQWMADAELTKTFFDASGETIEWIEKEGGVFNGVQTLGPSLKTWHTYDGMGAKFTKSLFDACKNAGVEVLLKSPAKGLVFDGEKVTGVLAETGNNDITQFNAKGIILASGGYADNPDMINKYTMHNYDDLTVMGSPDRTGDGILMAMDAGADTHVLGTMMMCGGAIKGMSASSQLNVCAGRQPLLWVNEKGERFANEGIVTNFSFTGNAMGLQKSVFNIIDGPTMKHITDVGCYNGRGVYVKKGQPLTEFEAEFEKEKKGENPYIFKCDTLDELAKSIEVDGEVFSATIDQYNKFCDQGLDSDYGKNAEYLQPIKEGPFYAFKLAKAYYCTVGGLKVNMHNQVVSTDGKPISGLYATGCDAGGLYGASYDVGIAAGSQQGWTAHGGRVAAKHIAAQ